MSGIFFFIILFFIPTFFMPSVITGFQSTRFSSFGEWIFDNFCVAIEVNFKHLIDVVLRNKSDFHFVTRLVQAASYGNYCGRIFFQGTMVVTPNCGLLMHSVMTQVQSILHSICKCYIYGWRLFNAS